MPLTDTYRPPEKVCKRLADRGISFNQDNKDNIPEHEVPTVLKKKNILQCGATANELRHNKRCPDN